MIIVTGASRGIGKSICKRLISQGQKVIGISRDISKLDFESYSCDISSYEEIKLTAQKIRKKGCSITALINAAGIASMNLALLTPKQTTQNLIQTNLIGTIYCCQIFAPLIIQNKSGSIVNFSSIAVPIGLKGESVYVASKSGIEGFSKSFAREMSSFNIRVNCIAPGPIETDLTKGVDKKLINKLISKQIIPIQFETSDISDLVEILLDNKFKSISGQVITPGGI
jgi:3-oxoacyl-[acyl-carrier protein] reductase